MAAKSLIKYRGMEQLVARRAHNTKVISSSLVPATKYGGVAQLARAFGSYPECQRFKSVRRYQKYIGPMVKRLRHRPFTAVTRVRIPVGSPLKLNKIDILEKEYGSIAQLGEHLPYKQGVIGSSPIVPTILRPGSSVG